MLRQYERGECDHDKIPRGDSHGEQVSSDILIRRVIGGNLSDTEGEDEVEPALDQSFEIE
jgi:hypothetical protein